MANLPLVAVMAAYNEADIIGAAVEHLVRQGAFVYLLDDGSTDQTVDAARTAGGDRLIGCESLGRPEEGQPERFRWSRILDRKAAVAASIDADWFIHQDADEFRESPWPHLTLAAAVALVGRLGWNAVEFEVFNFRPVGMTYEPGQDPLSVFTHVSPAEPFDRVQVRCWRKTAATVDLASTGGHEARFPGRRIFPIRFPMRHYPIRTAEQGARKIYRERKGRFDPEELARGWHVQYDRFADGQPVMFDDAALARYDADAVMASLQIRNRLVEEACPSIAGGDPPDLAGTVSAIEEDIVRQAAHVHALTATLARREDEMAALQASRDELQRWVENALAHVAALEAALRDARAEVDGANRGALDLARRLDDVFASRSWRITRPLRAAARLLGWR